MVVLWVVQTVALWAEWKVGVKVGKLVEWMAGCLVDS